MSTGENGHVVRYNVLNNRGVAQLASALAWGARGWKFESSRSDIGMITLYNVMVSSSF